MECSQQIDEKLEFQDQSNINEQIRQKWLKSLGNNSEIFIIDIYKPDHGSLGITLEGTIDIENGEKIGAHHYIRTLLSDGIIEKEGTLKSGDELLEVKSIFFFHFIGLFFILYRLIIKFYMEKIIYKLLKFLNVLNIK